MQDHRIAANNTTAKFESVCADIEIDSYDSANLPDLLHSKSSTC